MQEDLKDLEIDLSLEEMKSKSKNSFKRLVKIKAKEYALDHLLRLKEKHKKCLCVCVLNTDDERSWLLKC